MRGIFKLRLLLLPILLFGAILALPKSVYAASQTLAISPTNAQLKLNQGSTNNGTFNIINQGSGTYSFKIYATPFSVKGEDYSPDYTPIPGATNISNWFTFSTDKSTASEGQSIKVNYTIKVPKNTLDGGYYAVAFGETNNPKAAVGVTINQRAGMLFFIQVGENVVKNGSVSSFESKFLQLPPLTSVLRITNAGSIYFRANFKYTVKDMFGDTKLQYNGQKVILPQTTRRLAIPWTNSPTFGLFKVSGTVNFLGKDHALGTKYVLVMSKAARFYSIVAISGFIILCIVLVVTKKSRSGGKNRHIRRR